MSARLTDEQRILRTVTEAQWQTRVIAIAQSYGWTHYHPPKAGVRANGSVRTVPAGFPDLVLARGVVLRAVSGVRGGSRVLLDRL